MPLALAEPIKPDPLDITLTIRDGRPILKSPEHPPHAVVPEDFLIMVAIAAIFGDPVFRANMLAIVHQMADQGYLDGMIHNHKRDN